MLPSRSLPAGRWVMYEKPRFHGRKCVLAEGDVEIDNPWTAYGQGTEPRGGRPFRIGSFKRVVRVSARPLPSAPRKLGRGAGGPPHAAPTPPLGLPHPRDQPVCGGERRGRPAEVHRLGRGHARGRPGARRLLHHRPLRPVSGVIWDRGASTPGVPPPRGAGDRPRAFGCFFPSWLVYSKPFFDDDPYVLEPGGYPNLKAWGAKDPAICSLHPIRLVSAACRGGLHPKYLPPCHLFLTGAPLPPGLPRGGASRRAAGADLRGRGLPGPQLRHQPRYLRPEEPARAGAAHPGLSARPGRLVRGVGRQSWKGTELSGVGG